jgi:hypothetical protein
MKYLALQQSSWAKPEYKRACRILVRGATSATFGGLIEHLARSTDVETDPGSIAFARGVCC